jgi:hypothetical protein
MKSLILIFVFLVFFTGCATTPLLPPTTSDKLFSNEATLKFNVDGLNFKGVAAIPRKKAHTIKFDVPKNTEYAVISTCAGHPTFENPTGTITYVYEPIHFIEDTEKPCLVTIGVAALGVPLQLGIIDFYGEEVILPAWVTCNRTSLRTGGASMCQVATNDITRMVFDEPVLGKDFDGCNKIECKDAICTYNMTKNECGYIFRGLKSGKYHRHYCRGLRPIEK